MRKMSYEINLKVHGRKHNIQYKIIYFSHITNLVLIKSTFSEHMLWAGTVQILGLQRT